MNTKQLMYCVYGLLLFPLIAAGIVGGAAIVSQVHAQEVSAQIPAAQIDHMISMLGTDDRRYMVTMMRKQYGNDWQRTFNAMMTRMNKQS